jgi:hypothetical protein
MIIKVFFSPTEIRDFFQANGFQVLEMEFGRWDKSTHFSTKYITWMEDAVIIGEKTAKAAELFELLSEMRLKQMMTPTGNGTREMIYTAFNQLSNNN